MDLKKENKKEKGLTIIELIVAVGLFGLLSVFVTGAFLNIISMQKQAEAKQQIINDFRIALDLMGKEIMAGDGFPYEEDGTNFIFFSAKVRPDMMRRSIQYKLENGRIMKGQQDTQNLCNTMVSMGADGEEQGIFPDECFIPFTSEEIDVQDLTFYIHNFDDDLHFGHPIIVITASGEVNLPDSTRSFQTSVSYSPRSTISPDDRPPSDTTPPEAWFTQVNDGSVTYVETGDEIPTGTTTVGIRGVARDPGGSGIQRVTIRVYRVEEVDGVYYPIGGSHDYSAVQEGFPEGSTEDHDWVFDEVTIAGAGTTNLVEVYAQDYSGNQSMSADFIYITSSAPPDPPKPPGLDANYLCDTSTGAIDGIRLTFTPDDSGGPFSHYRIHRMDKDPTLLVTVERDFAEEHGYLDVDEFTIDQSYAYHVYSYNEDWNLQSDTPGTISRTVGLDTCRPSTPLMTVNLECINAGPVMRVRAVSTPSDSAGHFEIEVVDGDGDVEIQEGGLGVNEFEWFHPESEALAPGTYYYRSRVCFGEVCSNYTDPVERTITTNTCVPLDSFIWAEDPPTRPVCRRFPSDHPTNADVPSIAMLIGVQRLTPWVPDRYFHYYHVEECSNETCSGLPLRTSQCNIGGDPPPVQREECAVFHYLREDGIYHYRVRTYNEDTKRYGAWSSVYTHEIDGDMCLPAEPVEYSLTMEAVLRCTDDSDDDFRRIDILIDDNNHDETSTYRVYWCGDSPGGCDLLVGECSWNNRIFCTSHFGPADGQVHYYGVQICDAQNNCSSIYTPIEGFEGVAEGQCYPETAEVESFTIDPTSGCHDPDDNEIGVRLHAVTYEEDNDWNYINIYRDGELIVEYLTQGEVFIDDVEIGGEYDYEFEACNPFADIPCGPREGEIRFIEPNPCDPTTPFFYPPVVQCNDWGEITGLRLQAGGSFYHDGYRIERVSPDDTSFMCTHTDDYDEDAQEECTDLLVPTIAPPETFTYVYRAWAYRDGLLSTPAERGPITLDPTVVCEPPFEVKTTPGFITVTITGGGIGTRNSTSATLEVDPFGGFNETVYFDENDVIIELEKIMADLIDEDDIVVRLDRTSSVFPYDNGPRFSVRVPDLDYLRAFESGIGAKLTVVGRSAGFSSGSEILLRIRWDDGNIE